MSLMSFEMKSFGASAPFLAWPILYAGSVTKRPLRCSPIDDPYPKEDAPPREPREEAADPGRELPRRDRFAWRSICSSSPLSIWPFLSLVVKFVVSNSSYGEAGMAGRRAQRSAGRTRKICSETALPFWKLRPTVTS